MKVLVTGGSGFIGSHLVERLVGEGHDVDVLDDFSNSRNENIALVYKKATNVWQVDASRHPFLKELDGYAVVVHLLCFPRSLSFDFTERSVQVNLTATLRVLEVAERSRAKFIFASNSGLYDVVSGRRSHLPRSATWDAINERWPDKPTSPYDIHKQASENHIQLSLVKYTIFRFPSVFGPRQNHTEGWNPVIIEFFLKALQGKRPTIYGDGSVTRDFTYVSDIVDALMLSMTGGNRETLVLGTGVETSILDLWHKIAELTASEVEPLFEAEKLGDIKWMRYDASKAERILGWKPKTPLETGLRRVKEYLTKG